jgi:hypothetical protein
MSSTRRAPGMYGTDHNGYYRVEDYKSDEGVSNSSHIHDLEISYCDTAGQLAV